MQVAKALNDPIQGITALSRAGVSFTEQQKEQIKAMVEAGNIVGAQKIILAELTSEFGGAAKMAGGTFAGRLEILRNNLGDVAEEIGMALMPAVEAMFPMFQRLGETVLALMPMFTAFVQNTVDGFGMMTGYLSPVFAWIVDAAVVAFTAFETVIQEWDKYSEASMINFQLGAISSFNAVIHFLTGNFF